MVIHVVELQAFSGRPNPRWTLPEPQASHLTTLLSQLGEPAPAVPARLGYQGLTVHSQVPGGRWIPWLRVSAGTVTLLTGPQAGTYHDTAQLEDWLLGEAERAGLADVLDAVLPERRSER